MFEQVDLHLTSLGDLAELSMQLSCKDKGVNEAAFCKEKVIVRFDPYYLCPANVETLLGDPAKAKPKLGWVPEITAQEMCAEVVAADLAQGKQHALLKANGYNVNLTVE
ncbi:hypothetical protein C5F52_17530 [Limnohabitans sp. TS-CS-82]|nr:hypothetical protein C5F52_17530 [Limnohabitans sp. TS-CS-82]